MASLGYGIVRLDLLKGHALSYDFDTAIENGVCAEINYATGHITVTSANTIKQVLVASVPKLYDSVDESDFRNELNTFKARVFFFEEGDTFTTTQIDYNGDRANYAAVVVGDFAYAHAADGKFTINSTTAAAAIQEFKVIAKDTLNGYSAVVLQCIRTAIS